MPQVSVTIAGRSYRMACADGEEPRLESLARAFDEKITEMRSAFGEIGDMRLHVMAALTFADEAAELRGRVAVLDAERVRADEMDAERLSEEEAARRGLAALLDGATQRLERLSATLATKPR